VGPEFSYSIPAQNTHGKAGDRRKKKDMGKRHSKEKHMERMWANQNAMSIRRSNPQTRGMKTYQRKNIRRREAVQLPAKWEDLKGR